MKKTTLLIILLFINALWVYAQHPRLQQKTYPKQYFRAPLDLAPQAAGSFGELRANHFHSGTDYRTNQREGYPVYAAADGYISRARVQIGGGGNALYIDHPNGYTSVYMHLQRFNDKITAFVKSKQYEEKRFDVDFPLTALAIPVKKGEIIAYSGSTGAVAGPHVHFELRDTKTEHPINAQLFGLTIPDQIPPIISGITVYRFGNQAYSEETPREHLQVVGSKGQYRLTSTKAITINGITGFGIVTIDQNSASANRNGVYAIELSLDGTPIYAAVWESYSFDNSRAINAHIDYATYILHNRRVQKSFVEPGNQLEIYQKLVNNGLININDGKIHEVTYHVSDVMGNTSRLSFTVQNNPNYTIDEPVNQASTFFPYNKDNVFTNEQVRVTIPKGNLYSDLQFKYAQGQLAKNGYSYIHHIHNRMVPIHQGYTLAIKADRLPVRLQNKALLVSTLGGSQGGIYKDGYISTTARSLGSFYIAVDTVAPIIRSLNLTANKNMASFNRINFKISDNLSGIQSFNGFIDDQWVLMGYDPKTASIWHVFEKELAKGKHHFKLIVKDWKDNERTFEADFLR
ncbi:M23 family metallopeptidase [Olivibacter ginsenosidimutans]|uniref:M23 family metallopeptidase n=1 Tax=Olivibacter ginsenosidimutans TaxID=1176537 RepID=A0ABP9BN40_9SPHI